MRLYDNFRRGGASSLQSYVTKKNYYCELEDEFWREREC
jgi:hypothetical protein